MNKRFIYKKPTTRAPTPGYVEHSGQIVEVGPPDKANIHKITAADGWFGHAYSDELRDPKRKEKHT